MRTLHILIASTLLLGLSITYAPQVWIYPLMWLDIFTPWVLFESPLFDAYHTFLLNRLPVREELSIPELHGSNFTKEEVLRLSNGYTFPVVIRELLVNTSSVSKWSDSNWWVENYGTEPTLCGTLDNVRPDCVVKDFFDAVENNESFYISGASKLFSNNAELGEMIDDERVKALEPGPHVATQIFMGLKDMGSDIHSAMGVNIFRMIVGSKKWWFIPPSQTPYLKPAINVNGFSAHTHTMVGKNGEEMSPWMNKVERYTAVLNPGDVLINPPWFWHGIVNQGEKWNDLVIGCPTRFQGLQGVVAAFRSNPVLTLSAFAVILKNIAINGLERGDLEDKIKANRVDRMSADETAAVGATTEL